MFKQLIHTTVRQTVTFVTNSFGTVHRGALRNMLKAKKFVVVKYFQGEPKPTDLQLVEENVPSVQNGEFLVRAEYLSVDPYMRPYVERYPLGSTMIGAQVAKIIKSKNAEYPVGRRVWGYMGWRTHTVINLSSSYDAGAASMKPYLIPEDTDLPLSLCLGLLGMPGDTAYFGLLEICKPKKGETLVVSAAAGAVGSLVGQVAKHVYELHVIGIAGTDDKCKWLVDELCFDAAINYKTENVSTALLRAAPKGVDCYFDNVGGDISTAVIYQMKPFGRVAVCGSISSYNSDASSIPKTTILQPVLAFNQLKMEGFVVTRWADRFSESRQKNEQWLKEGKLRTRETITKGFENMFVAFSNMLKGQNVGKAIVEV